MTIRSCLTMDASLLQAKLLQDATLKVYEGF